MELAAEDAGFQKEVHPGASRSPLAAITNQAKLASNLVSKTPAESPFPPASQTSHEVVTVDTYVAECEVRGGTQEKQGGFWKDHLCCLLIGVAEEAEKALQ